jgi:hypothetical protein
MTNEWLRQTPFPKKFQGKSGATQSTLLLWMTAVFTALGCSATTQVPGDAGLVYCLSDVQRPHLAQAAATLDLVSPGSAPDRVVKDGQELSLLQWRALHRADFNRACAALAPTRQTMSSGLTTALLGTVNTLAGVLIGFLGAAWRDRVLRAERHARALQVATSAFVSACESYLRGWNDTTINRPPDTTLYERRGDLVAELRSVQIWHPDWNGPIERILATLSADFGEDLAATSEKWEPDNRAATIERVRALQGELRRLVADIHKIAHALEHPFRRHSAMHESVGPPPRETAS